LARFGAKQQAVSCANALILVNGAVFLYLLLLHDEQTLQYPELLLPG